MFKVDDVIISTEVAEVKFACNIALCKGACCVVGDAGAPVKKSEAAILGKAYEQLKGELRPDAREVVQKEGVVLQNKRGGYELNCTDGEACVFVTYNSAGAAICAIQKAYFEGRFHWEKPISCHLFPLRIKSIGGFEYINYQYVPALCSTACDHGEQEGIWLSDFVSKPLTRKYGEDWVKKFQSACREVRTNLGVAV